MKSIVALAIALTLPSAAIAQQARKCVPASQAEALITFVMPAAVRGAAEHCGKSLPATAGLIQSGPLIASRYQAEADAAWPDAKAAADSLAGMEVSKFMGQDGAREFLQAAIAEGMAKDVKPTDCVWLDKIITGLSPLPARNIASIFVGILQATAKPGKKEPIAICPVTAAD